MDKYDEILNRAIDLAKELNPLAGGADMDKIAAFGRECAAQERTAMKDTILDLRRSGDRLTSWVRAIIAKKEPLEHWRTPDSVEDVERAVRASYEKFPFTCELRSPKADKPKECGECGGRGATYLGGHDGDDMPTEWPCSKGCAKEK